jgi:hypothetical protein
MVIPTVHASNSTRSEQTIHPIFEYHSLVVAFTLSLGFDAVIAYRTLLAALYASFSAGCILV